MTTGYFTLIVILVQQGKSFVRYIFVMRGCLIIDANYLLCSYRPAREATCTPSMLGYFLIGILTSGGR